MAKDRQWRQLVGLVGVAGAAQGLGRLLDGRLGALGVLEEIRDGVASRLGLRGGRGAGRGRRLVEGRLYSIVDGFVKRRLDGCGRLAFLSLPLARRKQRGLRLSGALLAKVRLVARNMRVINGAGGLDARLVDDVVCKGELACLKNGQNGL